MNAKIRQAQIEKVPYMLVVGDKEAETDSVSVRLRNGENLGAMSVQDCIDRMSDEVARKTLS
jgi:threonyl-tRNA synthetase